MYRSGQIQTRSRQFDVVSTKDGQRRTNTDKTSTIHKYKQIRTNTNKKSTIRRCQCQRRTNTDNSTLSIPKTDEDRPIRTKRRQFTNTDGFGQTQTRSRHFGVVNTKKRTKTDKDGQKVDRFGEIQTRSRQFDVVNTKDGQRRTNTDNMSTILQYRQMWTNTNEKATIRRTDAHLDEKYVKETTTDEHLDEKHVIEMLDGFRRS